MASASHAPEGPGVQILQQGQPLTELGPELGARRWQAHAQLAPGFAGCSCETGMLEVPCPRAAS